MKTIQFFVNNLSGYGFLMRNGPWVIMFRNSLGELLIPEQGRIDALDGQFAGLDPFGVEITGTYICNNKEIKGWIVSGTDDRPDRSIGLPVPYEIELSGFCSELDDDFTSTGLVNKDMPIEIFWSHGL